MRYLVIKKENSCPEVIIWTKSQHQIPVKLGITRECSHRDYLRENNIPFTDVSSIGMIYNDVKSGKMEISVLPWDTPAPKEDEDLVKKTTQDFVKNNLELLAEIQKDWLDYQDWKEKSRALLAGMKRD